MLHPVHNVKMRVTSATTKKKVAAGIATEYTEYKTMLQNVQKALNAYVKSAESVDSAWTNLFNLQRNFSNEITAALPNPDEVRNTAQQYTTHMAALERDVLLVQNGEQPYEKLHLTILAYLKEIEDVQKKYTQLERNFSEYRRYSAKSDKLSAKKNKNENKIARNMDKKEQSRVTYQSHLDTMVGLMKSTWSKHPIIFRMVLCSFWLRNNHGVSMLSSHASQMFAESTEIQNTLLAVDITQPHTYASLLPASILITPIATPVPMSPVATPPHSMPILPQSPVVPVSQSTYAHPPPPPPMVPVTMPPSALHPPPDPPQHNIPTSQPQQYAPHPSAQMTMPPQGISQQQPTYHAYNPAPTPQGAMPPPRNPELAIPPPVSSLPPAASLPSPPPLPPPPPPLLRASPPLADRNADLPTTT